MTLETMIVARTGDIGGFQVRRALPSVKRRMVGPFVFLDQMGPAEFLSGHGLDVRPHPHIGLATVTYLFEGEIMHRDSLGTVQPIRPGEVNWMTAGSGIAHSERTAPELRAQGFNLFGIQAWVALPSNAEETAPAFVHHAAEQVADHRGARARRSASSPVHSMATRSPVETPTEIFYADAALEAGASIPLPAEHEERAVYVVAGENRHRGRQRSRRGSFSSSGRARRSPSPRWRRPRVMLLGGEPMDGPRHIWWNFVSSSQERIEQAKADWKAGRFGAVPGRQRVHPVAGAVTP